MIEMKNINIKSEVLISIVKTILSTIPGIDAKKPIGINFISNDDIPTINISYYPNPDILNIYDLSLKIQDIIYFKICNDFDLSNLIVNVKAY